MTELSADLLLGGRVQLHQPRRGYRVAIDPVLLAAATAASPGERVLDLGSGVGAAALCLAVRVPEAVVTGLEIDPELARCAALNACENGVSHRVTIVKGDLLNPPSSEIPRGSFDRVMTNPPFLEPRANKAARLAAKQQATTEGAADLAAWLDAAATFLRPRGTLTLIHRADRVDAILARLDGRFGSIVLFPLWPRAGAAARRVLVAARRGARGPARIAAGLVLHETDGGFTAAAEAILREAAPLVL
jgi:tRNA1(Val) A37 N6-methylase TrmN6